MAFHGNVACDRMRGLAVEYLLTPRLYAQDERKIGTSEKARAKTNGSVL